MQDRFLKQKIFGTMGCVAITLLCFLFYMVGKSTLDAQLEKERRAKDTVESVRNRLDLCHNQLQRHTGAVGQLEETKKTLAMEIHLMEMENSLLSQTNQESLASTAECESDVNTESARREDDDVSQQLKERILYETAQLKLQEKAIRKEKKNATRNFRSYADALRLENAELRKRHQAVLAKKQEEEAEAQKVTNELSEKPRKDYVEPVRENPKRKRQAVADDETEEKVGRAPSRKRAAAEQEDGDVPACVDNDDECPSWASAGECDANPVFMRKTCKRSCKVCGDQAPPRRGSPLRKKRAAARDDES